MVGHSIVHHPQSSVLEMHVPRKITEAQKNNDFSMLDRFDRRGKLMSGFGMGAGTIGASSMGLGLGLGTGMGSRSSMTIRSLKLNRSINGGRYPALGNVWANVNEPEKIKRTSTSPRNSPSRRNSRDRFDAVTPSDRQLALMRDEDRLLAESVAAAADQCEADEAAAAGSGAVGGAFGLGGVKRGRESTDDSFQ